MYGYIIGSNGDDISNGPGQALVSNKIFEMRMSNYFISKDENVSRMEYSVCKGLIQDIVKDGRFDMELCLRKFAEHYKEIYANEDERFLERHGRLLFLSFLRPLINGQGFYHIESQFTDLRRMDIIVDFGQDQFIVELKIWHGDKYKQEAYKQLLDYMNSKNAETGYILTFDFRKNANKQAQAAPSAEPRSGEGSPPAWVFMQDKRIFDVVV